MGPHPQPTAAAEAQDASAAAASGHLLQVRDVVKTFPGVRACSDVHLDVAAGEIVGLVGENGAGKSTLAKIIAGVYAPDSGRIVFDGEERAFRNVREGEAAGIVLIPQELQVAPRLSIAENMFMGALPTKRGVVDRGRLHAQTAAQLRFFGLEAEPFAPLSTLATSEQRLVTVAAALWKRARLLILDEPTASLTDSEAQRLFEHMATLRAQGIGFIYVSHRLDEIEQIVDRVVVMRDGRVVRTFPEAAGQRRAIVRAMIGREPEEIPRPGRSHAAEPVLRVSDLSVRDPLDPDRLRVDGVSFEVRQGEVLGFFGLVGAGRTELATALFGSWPGEVSGQIEFQGKAWRPVEPRRTIRDGIVMLTEDRKQTGIMEGQSINANMSAASIGRVARSLFIDSRREHRRNLELVRRLNIRPPRLEVPIETLSGGNQQKVLLARWLATDPRLLILDEPTVGLDVGARFEVFRLIRELAAGGRAVLMISSDLEEVLAEADRILVMYKGRITGEFPAGARQEDLLAAATGGEEAG